MIRTIQRAIRDFFRINRSGRAIDSIIPSAYHSLPDESGTMKG